MLREGHRFAMGLLERTLRGRDLYPRSGPLRVGARFTAFHIAYCYSRRLDVA